MKRSKIAAIGFAVLIITAALLLTIGLPSGALTSMITTRVARDTGYRIIIAGPSKINLLPSPGVSLGDVTLQPPGDDRPDRRLHIGSVRAELSLQSLLGGTPRVTALTLTRPELRIPLIRDRSEAAARPPTDAPAASVGIAIDHVSIADGVVIMANAADGVEQRFERINASLDIDAEHRIDATGSAIVASRPAQFAIKTGPVSGAQAVAVDLKVDAPELLHGPLVAKADVKLRGALLQINGLSGSLGPGAFNGWAAANLAGKPQLKLDLDFQRLDLGETRKQPVPPGAPWSDARFDLSGLNYLDGQIRISTAELNLGGAHLAPASIDATLSNGAMTAQLTQLGAYGGTVTGQVALDVAQRTPVFSLRAEIAGVMARPLLTALADVDRIDGRLQAELTLRAGGDDLRAVMSSIEGTAALKLRDGEIRGLNVAATIRKLTTTTLSGWQTEGTDGTDLTELAASFRIAQGKATTSDLALAGPLVRMTGAGTVDLGAKALALKVEPKLVLTMQGQSTPATQSKAEPVGLGIPVVIDGPWTSPRIYPDAAGMLDDPEAAYARLKAIGKGLFGARGDGRNGSASGTEPSGDSLGESIGRLIQQGLQNGTTKPQAPGSKDPGRTGADVNAIMKQLFGR